MDAATITAERNATHGDWYAQSACSQQLKNGMQCTKNWPGLSASQRDALEMIAVKISRILTGNPDEPDHWLDIEGYASLARRNL